MNTRVKTNNAFGLVLALLNGVGAYAGAREDRENRQRKYLIDNPTLYAFIEPERGPLIVPQVDLCQDILNAIDSLEGLSDERFEEAEARLRLEINKVKTRNERDNLLEELTLESLRFHDYERVRACRAA